MCFSNLFGCFLILVGAFAIIFMVINAINGLRDCMKMSLFARVAKESTYRRGTFQMYKFGMVSMLFEGDTMRASSAILGFTNGRVISQPESVVAMLSASSWKALWIWLSGVILLLCTMFEQSWVVFSSIGFIIILLNISKTSNIVGRLLFFIGMLMLSLQLSISTLSSLVTQIIGIDSFLQYTMDDDIMGILFSAFAGIFVGAVVSGNLLSSFLVMICVLEGVVGTECGISFLIASEIGTLFPMSFMVSNTNHQAKLSFLCFAIVEAVVLIISIFILLLVPMGWLSQYGTFGVIVGYTIFYSALLPLVYYLIGTGLWSKVKATHDQLSSSKRHLHQFDSIYRPHVSLMLIQSEKEIVNLQYRIHKMLDFIIDIIDNENVQGSMEHVRKYNNIVNRTANEITNFIITQTSEKTNDHVSAFAKEQLYAVTCQCQLGSLFCDLAEAVYHSDKDDGPIMRRCVVALETLFNQSTKIIDMRYSVLNNEIKNFDGNVEMLTLQLTNILSEYGHASCIDVFSYAVQKSSQNIVEIINNLK